MQETLRRGAEGDCLAAEFTRSRMNVLPPSTAVPPSVQPAGAPAFPPVRMPAGARPPTGARNGAVRRSVILEADDLGLVYAFNEGIRHACQQGGLTSTCIRANGYAYEHAIHEVLPACPGLGLGVHLCLNEAEPVLPAREVPALVGPDGCLRGGFVWLMQLARTAEGLAQIERELRAQIEKVLSAGVRVDHLNSHQHVHMIPVLFRVTCRLAREYGIPAVRLTREVPYKAGGLWKRAQPLVNTNYVKHLLLNRFALINEAAARRFGLATTDYFVGVSYTANMSLVTILDGLRASPFGCVEVLLHPAIGPDPRDRSYPVASLRRYVAAPQRAIELEALRTPELPAFLQRERWMATNFSSWSDVHKTRRPRETTPDIPDEARRVCESVVVSGPLWVSAAQDDSRVFAQLVISQAAPGQRVLDVGTGTGIIAIALAKMGRHVSASDISGAALRTARANAARNGTDFPCTQSDLLASVEGRFDLIAFNPPYNFGPDSFATNVAKNLIRRIPFVRRNSGLAMPRTVLRFHQQLIERLIAQAPAHLNPGGRLLIHAYDSEVGALCAVLPEGADVEILNHPELGNRTVGLMIRLPG